MLAAESTARETVKKRRQILAIVWALARQALGFVALAFVAWPLANRWPSRQHARRINGCI
jgi:hypothetical protein